MEHKSGGRTNSNRSCFAAHTLASFIFLRPFFLPIRGKDALLRNTEVECMVGGEGVCVSELTG